MKFNPLLPGLLALLLGLSACCATRTPDPKAPEISIGDAMRSVAEGLRSLKSSMDGTEAGLLPADVEVTFRVTASNTDAKSLAIDLSVPSPIDLGIKADSKQEAKVEKGNSITLRFKSVLFVDEKSLVGSGNTKKLEEIIAWLKVNFPDVYTLQ